MRITDTSLHAHAQALGCHKFPVKHRIDLPSMVVFDTSFLLLSQIAHVHNFLGVGVGLE